MSAEMGDAEMGEERREKEEPIRAGTLALEYAEMRDAIASAKFHVEAALKMHGTAPNERASQRKLREMHLHLQLLALMQEEL